MSKVVLMIHGWPRPVDKNGPYYKYFGNWGYKVVAPEIFSKNFVLTLENVKKFIGEQLSGHRPDVIMGISLGGLIAPYIARDFPDSKLIMIATGAKLRPESLGFKILVDLAKNRQLLNILSLARFLPQKMLFGFYELINPFKGEADLKEIYLDDMKRNFKYIINLPISEESEIINFVSQSDTTNVLRNLKNRSLIFTGKNDILMPDSLADELHRFLVNSKVITNDGGHFNTISDLSFEEMRKFLVEE